jgi:hypothetical protein
MTAASIPALALLLALASPAQEATDLRRAVVEGNYPWFDSSRGAVKPLWPHEDPAARIDPATGSAAVTGIGALVQLLITALLFILLAALILLIIWAIRVWKPGPVSPQASLRSHTGATGTRALPSVLSGLDLTDPWSEACRARDRGDLGSAIIALFVYELLGLERIQAIRLDPSRTGRQLVRSIPTRDWRRLVEPTLRLFERYFYGRRELDSQEFQDAWSLAEEFRQRTTALHTLGGTP